MYRPISDFEHRSVSGAALMGCLMFAASVFLIGGCATNSSNKTENGSASATADTPAADAPREEPARPARVKVEGDEGFTVTEVVSITGEGRANYREAVRLLAQDDFEAGIALLVEVTEKAPDATAPFVDLGIAYTRTGAFDEAESSFRRALASTPDHPVAHNELGIVYRKQGRFAEARQSYERALAIFPGFHYARRNLAVLCDLYIGDLACALEHYESYRQTVADDREVDIWISDIRNRISPAQ
jgi:Flp pilus assembly protein TadD